MLMDAATATVTRESNLPSPKAVTLGLALCGIMVSGARWAHIYSWKHRFSQRLFMYSTETLLHVAHLFCVSSPLSVLFFSITIVESKDISDETVPKCEIIKHIIIIILIINSNIISFFVTLSAPRPVVEEGELVWWCVKGPVVREWMTTTVTSWTSHLTWSNATCSPAQALLPGIADRGRWYDSTYSFLQHLSSPLRACNCE